MIATEKTASSRHQFTVIVTFDPESGTFLADVPTLGFQTYGFSVEHAFEMAEEAIAGRLEVMAEIGEEIPHEDHPPEMRQVAV